MQATTPDDSVPGQFRRAMRHLAATVTVISTETDGARYGMTATAVTPVSMEPASILVAVNQQNFFHQHVSRKGAFCVNLLSSHHTAECFAFGGKVSRDSRFVGVQWKSGPRSLPYLIDAEASIFCVLEQSVDYGTHTIFIGKVDLVMSKDGIDPLIYLNGGFLPNEPMPLEASA